MMKSMIAVLIGLILSLCTTVQAADTEVPAADRFQLVAKGVVLDKQTGLMWATEDNGSDINWNDAKKYCESYQGGGFSDWRMPDQKELGTLYDAERKNKDGYGLATDLITVTDCCPWAADYSMNGAGIFSFKTGNRPWGYMADTKQLRALPVRNATPKDNILTKTKAKEQSSHKAM